MKVAITIALLHSFFICASQIIIHGKIENYDGKSAIRYNAPKDGIIGSYAQINSELLPNRDGSFKIRYQNKGYGMAKIFFRGMTYPLFHSEKSEITLIIDQSKIKVPTYKPADINRIDHILDSVRQRSIVSIGGDFSEVNRFYSRTIRPRTSITDVSGSDFSKLILGAHTAEKVVNIMDSLIGKEIYQIENLQIRANAEYSTEKGISKEVKNFLKNQVYCFYGGVFLNGVAMKRYKQAQTLAKDPGSPLTEYNPYWERVIEDFVRKVGNKIEASANCYEFNDFVFLLDYTLSEYKNYNLRPQHITNDQLIIEKLINPNLEQLDSLSLLDGDAVLAFKLQYLFRFLYTETFYSPTLLHAVNELKREYPNSQHLDYFEPQIQKLKAYLKSASTEYDKGKFIETNYLKFEDLLHVFKGQNILVDLWATWCSPCIKEFSYKEILKPYVNAKKIVVLYISLDNENLKKKWKENIKFNQLDGYHILANDVLIQDIWEKLGGEKGAIPRYALVNKNGNIVVSDAARPSNSKKLSKQIDDLLSLSN